MKKVIFLLSLIAFSFGASAQKNVFPIKPKTIFPGDTARAVIINATTNNFDSTINVSAVVIVMSGKTNYGTRVPHQYHYKSDEFGHFPAKKSEILEKVEHELDIKIINP